MRNIKEGLKVGRDIGIDFLESVCRKISTVNSTLDRERSSIM